MNISKRNEKSRVFTFCHGMHIYEVDLKDLKHGRKADGAEDPRQVVFEGEILCIREGCPACAQAAEARGIPGYRVPVHSICWPVDGDSEAMEMHLRHRMGKRKGIEETREEIRAILKDDHDKARLDEAVKQIGGEVLGIGY